MSEAFIGRERQVAVLDAGLQDAIGGRGGVFLIAGEPGIGKTALADHVAGHAAELGALVLWGRSWEGGGAAPYWTWAQILRALVGGLDEATLGSLLSREIAHIALLVPELTERLGEAAEWVRSTDSAEGRFHLFEATTRFLKEASSVQPMVLVLDDLLAGDRPSLLLLRFLATDVRDSHLLVVVTHRDAEATRLPEAAELLASLVREGHLLGLRGLNREEVGRLIAQLSGTEPAEGKVAAIHQATGGNPLFVREVIRLLITEDSLDRPGRLSVPIPDSVRAVIRQRLAPLSADAVQVLSSAAVVGREFDLTLVGPACDLPTDRVLASLSEAVSLGVVEAVPEKGATYRFSHPLMREGLYEGLPIPARIQIHRRVGEAIERVYGPDPASHLGELAYHFSQVAATGEGAKAGEYARKAGERAMESHAYEDAVAQYRRALDVVGFAGPDEALRCELLLCLGSAQARAGDYQECKSSFVRAAEIARRLEIPEQMARAARGYGEPQVEGGSVDQQLLALLQEALDALSLEDSAVRSRLLARFSMELAFSDEPALRDTLRENLSGEALEMARRLDAPAAIALACRARWMALWGPDGLDERSELSEEILRLAWETGDRALELVGRARRITCSTQSGDIGAAKSDIAAHARLAGELHMPYHEWTAMTLRAERALLDGSFGAAEEFSEESLSLLPGRPGASQAHFNQATLIRWEQGRLGELREAWQELVEQFPQAAFGRGWLSLSNAELGNEEDARGALRSLVEELSELPRNGLWLPALATASLAAAHLHEPDAAESMYPLLLPYARRTIVIPVPHPVVCFGSASLYLGLLATALSRWEEAGEHFESAIQANGRLRARAFLARSQYEYARMLVRRGQAAARGRVGELLDRAEPTARALGMAPVGTEIERLRELEAGAAVAARQGEATVLPKGRGKSVFRREADYWTVVYEGSLVRLRDSKGLRHLARLLADPGREFHASDLEVAEGSARKPAPSTGGKRGVTAELEARPDLGDAGELLDAKAKAAYKSRLEELQSELDEAESFNDPGRAAKAKEEMDFLAKELARAVGLGGRERKAASHAERARLNATRAIRAAIGNLSRVNPALGRHLSATIRTGRYCAYTPDPRAEITWEA